MEMFVYTIPLLLSFLIGLLVGVLAGGFRTFHSPSVDRILTQSLSDSLVWLLLLAAFSFGILITLILITFR